jgi:serine protease Do
MLVLGFWSFLSCAAESAPSLPSSRYLHGEQTLRAFASISKATRDSIVKFNVNGETVALGTIVDNNGLTLTKASELKTGKLTCWLADEREVRATVMQTDEEEDVALVKIQATNLKPIQWTTNTVAIGQWAITPGIAATPQAVGIISATPRRIRPPRALIGVQFDITSTIPKIQIVASGLGAEKAGLKPGDTILAVNDSEVTNREQIVETLRDFRDGTTVKFRIAREAKPFDVEIRMQSPKPGGFGSESLAESRNTRLNGEVSHRAEGFDRAIEHDSVLAPWLCGGPLVNLDGKAIGLNIARASRVSTYALPAEFVQHILDRLRTTPTSAGKKS